MSRAPLVVFAVGNPSRGDDALGPLLAEALAGMGQGSCVEIIEDFQLQIEHVLDLEGRQMALFIDAGVEVPAPFIFRRLQADEPAPAVHSTHALEPAAVLQVFRRALGGEPPPAWLLCIRGESFALGEGLSPAASRHLAAAREFAAGLLADSRPEAWNQR